MGIASTASAEVSTSTGVSARQAFEQWEAIVADAVLPSIIEPLGKGPWHGRVRSTQFDRSSLTLMTSSAQRVVRTRRQLDRATGEFLLVNIVVEGSNWTEQSGRITEGGAGTIAFYDSALPIESRTTENATSTIVRAPLAAVLEHAGLAREELPIAKAMPTTGAMGVVADFFRGMAVLPADETDRAANVLESQVTSMLSSAVLLANGHGSPAPADSLFTRQQVLAVLRRRYTDPDLTVDEVAHECLVSRRTLYRVCEDIGGPAALVRRMRVEHARRLLRADPNRPLSGIAAASGFATDRHFYRAFRQETGVTPGQFRSQLDAGTRGR
ncbi:helix-turn-helix domain-containing protein [Nocardia sp. ET3-3]|uniref:Helix-turn-helix domain-containing protein n=1 Tax=Nocardia terrae TaxID=2675851 RepID=A0A7K1UX85_9NOCA|nr:AraC family transcriptional regulator [Nocardia terrae]MVU78912.1 helix-turn-helix domain-containing protein [Nocardia terrae]